MLCQFGIAKNELSIYLLNKIISVEMKMVITVIQIYNTSYHFHDEYTYLFEFKYGLSCKHSVLYKDQEYSTQVYNQ